MATFKGTHATSFDSTPPANVDARLHGGHLFTMADAFEIPDTANADVVIVFRLPVDAVVKSVRLANDALTAGTFDIGTYKKNSDGTYTAVSATAFASAVAVSSANGLTDVTYEAAATDISKRMQPLYTRSGLSARPAYGDLYIGISTPTGTGASATVLLEVDYTL